MSFVNGIFLGALIPLLGLPLLIHLLNRTFPYLLRFPNVENLRRTIAQRSRLYRYRHLILLLLRTIFLALLLTAFLKPKWEKYGPLPKDKTTRNVIILLDHSLSMEYESLGASPRKRAIQEATKILNGLKDEDLANVVLVENMARPLLVSPSKRHWELVALLQRVEPGYTSADFSSAVRMAAEQLNDESAAREVYYISDFQRSNWADVDFHSLPDAVRSFYVDVGQEDAFNTGILDASFNRSLIRAGDTAMLEVKVGNYAGQPFEGTVAAILNDRTRLEASASIAPWSVGSVVFPIEFGKSGLQRCEIQIPDDRLKPDSRCYVSTQIRDSEPVLLVTDSRTTKKAASYFISAALNPYESADKGAITPMPVPSRMLTSARLAEVKKIFISDIGSLSGDTCSRLAQFVFNGGAVVYFLDGPEDPGNLEGLKNAMGEIPLTLYQKRSLQKVADGGQQIAKGDFRSPHLQLFRGELRRNLGLLEFYDFYSASHTGSGDVVLSFTDGTPALASMQYGLGSILLLNFSASELSSNIARQRIFPAWMHALTESLNTTEAVPISYLTGERVHAEVWKEALDTEGVRAPDGSILDTSIESMASRYAISFVPHMPGFHTLGGSELKYICAVNPPADEADLRRVDRERLGKAIDGTTQGYFVAEREEYSAVAWGVPVFHLFILAGILFLALEVAFQWLVERLGRAS